MKRSWRDPRVDVPSLEGWHAYAAAQRGRRIRRRAVRKQALIAALPPGVTMTPMGHGTTLRLEGHGAIRFYDPTHNTVSQPGTSGHRVMTPEKVAREFVWLWKRENCPV